MPVVVAGGWLHLPDPLPLTALEVRDVENCEHDWRTGPVVHLDLRRQAVCIRCFGRTVLEPEHATKWPEWTEQDYWDNLDALEGDLAPEIRRMRAEGRA